MDYQPGEVGSQFPGELVRSRVGADEQPRRRQAMETETEWVSGRHVARCSRSVEKARGDDADDGPRTEDGPRIYQDYEAFSGTPGRARGRLCQGVVQAAASGHGPDLALPGTVGCGPAALAGPSPESRSSTDRRTGHRLAQGEDPGGGTVRLAARSHRLVIGGLLPRHRQAWRGQWRAHPPRTSE